MSSSEEMAANLERATTALRAARVLLDAELPNDAASRAYYGAFQAATALLLSKDLSFGSHAGVLRAVSLNFVKAGVLSTTTGRNLNWLAELRQVADYGEMRQVSIADAERAVDTAEQFLRQVQALLGSV